MTHDRAYLLSLFRARAYRFSETPFTLKSGRTSQHYVDCRPVLLNQEALVRVARLLQGWVDATTMANGFAGVVTGACPVVDQLVREGDPGALRAYVRPEAKDHGTKKLVEMDFKLSDWLKARTQALALHAELPPLPPSAGPTAQQVRDTGRAALLLPKPRLVLVEDVWTTGGSAMKAKAALEEEGIEVAATICIVDRQEPDTQRPDFALFTLNQLNSAGPPLPLL